MKNINGNNNCLILGLATLIIASTNLVSCQKNNSNPPPDLYQQSDQMGRPAINTVFIGASAKDSFNTTVPSQMASVFGAEMKTKLLALNPGYTTNLLGLDADQFIGVVSTDVLNSSTTSKTTFYDGTNVLTGRALSDDVIDVELTLVFGGPAAKDNPGLSSDHVDGNDKPFLSSFPYLAEPH
jgi:Domain of unknown function (DUF4331)